MAQTNQTVYLLSNDRESEILQKLELIGRVCYKSEHKITENSAIPFVKKLIQNEHLSVLEHVNLSVVIKTNRAIANELVRHRHCAFTQESTRFVKYDDIDIINSKLPPEWDGYFDAANDNYANYYKHLVTWGVKPELAREYLPLGLATTLYMTTNLRGWRHIIKLRQKPMNHPLMRQLMHDILQMFTAKYENIFGDIVDEYGNK